MTAGALRALRRRIRPPRPISVTIRDITFEVPGQDAGHASDPSLIADVLLVHEGALIIRNCHIRGAISLQMNTEGVLLVKGLADSSVRYEPPR